MSDPAFQREVAQIRAHAALDALPGDPPVIHWAYRLPRMLRNATAALIDVESIIDDGNGSSLDLVAIARRLGQLWESISRISDGKAKSIAQTNAILAYELAGYQANSVCIARELLASKSADSTDSLTTLIATFFRRQFFRSLNLAERILNTVPNDVEEISELVSLTSQGLVAGALVEVSRYFLSGDSSRIDRAIQMLQAASSGFASIGAVSQHSLVRLLLKSLPRMRHRSTWERLGPIHESDPTWQRYLLLLARGLGQRVDMNSGIVELWPSQISALDRGLFDLDSSTMVRMPTSAGKTRIAEMAIVHHLVSTPGRRCLYIAPFRALAGEIEGALAGLFSDLGFRLSTTLGSFETDEAEQEILSTADVIISTPEKLDLLLRSNREFFDSVGLIVIDEGQLIEDDSRGPHFEILLSRIRLGWPSIRFISLSAVIPESTLEEFSAWLGSNGSTISQSDWRPAIQRHAKFYWKGARGFVQFLPDPEVPGLEGFLPSMTQVRTFPFVNPESGRVNNPKFPDASVKAQTAAELAYTLAPTGAVLVFCPTPGYADSVSEAIMRRIQLAEQSGQSVLPEFRDRSTRASAICADWLGESHRLTVKLRRGVAVHHGDVPDVVKKAIERDFRDRQYQIIVATSTLAQGVNLPIKTVIIHSTHRRIDGENVPLSAREYWNIAGRAGRAGVETEGLIIHLCQNVNDEAALWSYARRKNDTEPLESALLKALRRFASERINDPEVFQYLDSDLLAVLVEEAVTEVTDEWIERVFGSTLAALESRRNDANYEAIQSSFGRLLRDIVRRVPEPEERAVFATTGLSVQSCESMLGHIRSHADELRELLPTATLAERRQLVEIFLDGCFMAEEIRPKTDPVFEVAELAEAWLSGEDYPQIRRQFSSPEATPQSISAYVEDTFGYRLPWGIAAYLRLALKELEIDDASLSPIARFFSSMVKYGVPTPYAVWAIAAGVSYRSVAIQLGQEYVTSHSASLFPSFMDWASKWNLERLNLELGLSGSVLEDVAHALQQASPSPLIRRSVTAEEPLFPLSAQVITGSRVAILTVDLLTSGTEVQFSRDYSQTFNRNAVSCYFNNEPIGTLDNDVAQLIAPTMDAGTQYMGIVTSISSEAYIRRVFVDVSPS